MANWAGRRPDTAFSQGRRPKAVSTQRQHEVAAVAAAAGVIVAKVAATDSWEPARERLSAIVGRGDPEATVSARERLGQSRSDLSAAPAVERERVSAQVAAVWRARLEDLLRLFPAAEPDLRDWLADYSGFPSPGMIQQFVLGSDHSRVAAQGSGIQIINYFGGDDRGADPGVRLGSHELEDYLAAAERAAAAHPFFAMVPDATTPPLSAMYLHQRAVRHDVGLPEGNVGSPPEPDRVEDMRLSAAEIVSQGRTCVVLAGPGGGKSSLLHACLSESVGRWRRGVAGTMVPVLVTAAQLVEAPLLNAVAEAVSSELAGHGLIEKLTAAFFREPPNPDVPWLLLVDGLDEISSPGTRRRLLRELSAITDRTRPPEFRFVVATRPLPDGELDLLGSGVPRYQLQSFTREDILQVAAAWFAPLGTQAGPATARFAAELARRGRLAELARTPLITALICSLYAASPGRELPDSRGEIYQDFTTLLFSWLHFDTPSATRDLVLSGLKETWASEQAQQTLAALPKLIGYFAAQRHAGDTRPALEIITAQPDARCPDRLPEEDWKSFLDAALRRSNVVTARRPGEYEFLHVTLQDYLAARHASQNAHDRARILRPILRVRPAGLGRARWVPPREDTSYLGFILDPGVPDITDTARGLERLTARGGLEGCRFIAALSQLGTRLPDAAVRRTVDVLERAAHSKRPEYARDPIAAARILVDIDRVRGLDLLASLALEHTSEDRRFDAVREMAALDRARAADLMESLAHDASLYRSGRLRAARLAFQLDHQRGADLLESMAIDPAEKGITEREDTVRLLTALDHDRGCDTLELMIRTSSLYYRERLAKTLAELDQQRAVEVLESLMGEPGTPHVERSSLRSILAEIRESAASTEPARDPLSSLDLEDEAWIRPAMMQMLRRRLRSGGRRADAPNDAADDAHEALPPGLLGSLDDPRAVDILDGIARGAQPNYSWARVTAAWQLAQLHDPRAADLLDELSRDSSLPSYYRRDAIDVLAGLDRQRALSLMDMLAEDTSLEPGERRRTDRARTEFLKQHPPETRT
jgi:hypothetical protein